MAKEKYVKVPASILRKAAERSMDAVEHMRISRRQDKYQTAMDCVSEAFEPLLTLAERENK